MAARFGAAVVRQATPPGLVGGHRLEQDATAAGVAGRRRGCHSRQVRGGLREAERRQPHRMARGRQVKFAVMVEVSLRPGIADPQGATIERALPALGFDSVHGVRTGKAIRFSIDAGNETEARTRVDELCQRFLTNPVIEDATVTLTSDSAVNGAAEGAMR